jgi:hypothetical protein
MDGWKYGTCCLDIYLNKVSLVFDAVVSRIAVLLAVFPCYDPGLRLDRAIQS